MQFTRNRFKKKVLPFGFGKNVSFVWLGQCDVYTGRTLGNNCGLWMTFSSGGVVAYNSETKNVQYNILRMSATSKRGDIKGFI